MANAHSETVSVTTSASFGVGTDLLWDAYWRRLYNRLDQALQQQANQLLQRGAVTEAEARALCSQRDLIRAQVRSRLSPFGRLYSEITDATKTFDERLAQKRTVEAVLRSVGKSREAVNRLTSRMRMVGRATIVLQFTVSAVIILRASPEDRPRVAARQGGSIAGGMAGGWAGAWAGCAGATWVASPSLAVPVAGEIATGGACVIGGILGGMGFGALGAWAGEKAGERIHDYVTTLEWVRR